MGKSWPGGQASPKRTVNRFVTFRFGQFEPTYITRPCFRPGPPCLLELFALTGKVQPDQPASLARATVPGSWLARLEPQCPVLHLICHSALNAPCTGAALHSLVVGARIVWLLATRVCVSDIRAARACYTLDIALCRHECGANLHKAMNRIG